MQKKKKKKLLAEFNKSYSQILSEILAGRLNIIE
jgi:hypothetical protein